MTARNRILLVSGPAAGGIRTHLSVLLEHLPACGVEAALAAPEMLALPEGPQRFPLEIGDRPAPGRDLRAAAALRRAVRSWQPQVVHAHGLKAALLTGLALSAAPVPWMITFHNLLAPGPLVLLGRRLLAGAHGVAVSRAVAETAAAVRLPLSSLDVIPNGVDVERFTPGPGARGTGFRCGYAGRLTEEKGVRVLLQAIAAFRSEERVRFRIAGDGPLREEVRQAAAGSGGLLDYVGPLAEVAPFYRELDAFLAPSRSEGQGLAALEAMACGVPVIASRVGGLPEVVAEGQSGVLVPPGDAGALAAAIRELARDPDGARRLGQQGRERVRQEFSREVMLDRLLRKYRALARRA